MRKPIDPEFPAQLGAVERVRRENRRDTPFGFGISLSLHALFMIMFGSLAAGVYLESIPQKQTNSPHVVFIQTLVRQTLVRPSQPVKPHFAPRPLNLRKTVSVPHPFKVVKRYATAPARARRVAFSPRTPAHRANLPRTSKRHGSKGLPQTVAPASGIPAAANVTAADPANVAGANSSGGSAIDDPVGPIGRTNTGTVWNERPPTGPFTDKNPPDHGYCTPSRGGFFHRR